MRRLNRAWRPTVIALAVTGLLCRIGQAETYRAELAGITSDAQPDAKYLQASFDFGTRFSSIDSVAVELTMPSGYGYAVAFGHSSSISFIQAVVHDASIQPDFASYSDVAGNAAGLVDHVFVQSNTLRRIDFRPYSYIAPHDGDMIVPERDIISYWPTFLYSGKGQVTLQTDTSGDFNPNFPDPCLSDTCSYHEFGKPPTVTQATLVVKATPAPESSSLILMLIGLIAMAGYRYI